MNVRPDNTAAALNPAQASVIRAGELGRVSIAPASDATGQLTSSGSPSSRFERNAVSISERQRQMGARLT
jgi:hypothetical protein